MASYIGSTLSLASYSSAINVSSLLLLSLIVQIQGWRVSGLSKRVLSSKKVEARREPLPKLLSW